MAHRSRLSGFIIDCKTEDLPAAADFWSKALGMPVGEAYVDGEAEYTTLAETPADLYIEVQKVGHDSRGAPWTSNPTTSKRKLLAWKPWAQKRSPGCAVGG